MSGRTLLVASGGGHLAQLKNLAERLPWDSDSRVWITVNSPSSHSMLENERDVIYVPTAGPRDLKAALMNARMGYSHIRRGEFTHALSTGASLAVSVLPLARAAGVRCHYVESAARVLGPSLSGKILGYVPGLHRYTQYENWVRQGWSFAGCVFDSFKPGERINAPQLRRLVVTLGTLAEFPFRSLILRLAKILPPTVEVLWQTGCTSSQDLQICVRPMVSSAELVASMSNADVVVAHAGVGSALSALEAGRIPILVPRRLQRGEHVDDHQAQLARELSERGLAIALDVEQLTLEALLEASTARLAQASHKLPVLNLRDS